MILLNSESEIIRETLKLSPSTPVNRLEKVDISFEDHSGGHFHLYATSDRKEIKLSIRLPAWREISKDPELIKMIKEEYEFIEPDEGFDFTIFCKIENFSENEIKKFSQLKQQIISLPLRRVFKNIRNNLSTKTFITSLGNGNDDFYAVVSGPENLDQIVVLFGINFVDETDTILAKVFLQEFYDVRNNRLEDAPVVLYGKEAPKELSDSITAKSSNLNYLTLVLFPRHYSTDQSKDHLAETIPFLSDYLHYHLKCSKAYLHQRMRAKTGDFLKILNRSKPENFQ